MSHPNQWKLQCAIFPGRDVHSTVSLCKVTTAFCQQAFKRDGCLLNIKFQLSKKHHTVCIVFKDFGSSELKRSEMYWPEELIWYKLYNILRNAVWLLATQQCKQVFKLCLRLTCFNILWISRVSHLYLLNLVRVNPQPECYTQGSQVVLVSHYLTDNPKL